MSKVHYSLRDLRVLFERNLTARDVAEALVSFDVGSSAEDVRNKLEIEGFDVAGAREGGLVGGYVRREDLQDGSLRGYVQPFSEEELVSDSTPLSEVLTRLATTRRVFVLSLDHVAGIITRADLRKEPVRMWLFGVVSLLEMQLLRLIRDFHPDDDWTLFLSDERIAKARSILRDRAARDEDIDLAECTELTDKTRIAWRSRRLREALHLPSEAKWRVQAERLRRLRDGLAHGREFRSDEWPELMLQVDGIQDLLLRAEGLFKLPQ